MNAKETSETLRTDAAANPLRKDPGILICEKRVSLTGQIGIYSKV